MHPHCSHTQWLGCQGQACSTNIHLLNRNILQTHQEIVGLALRLATTRSRLFYESSSLSTCLRVCSLISSARAFCKLSHTVAVSESGSQHQRPLIESEYYAAPLRYRESSTSTACGKISAGGAIYCKRIRLALTHSGWTARNKLAASTSTYRFKALHRPAQ